MRKITFTNGATVPALGQGTWYMGDRADQRAREERGGVCRVERGERDHEEVRDGVPDAARHPV